MEWPAGADDDTPECQDASAATLAIVNESLHTVAVEDGLVESVLHWLSARPDRELGVWTLTGLIENEQTARGTEGGYFAVWATRGDPTSATFDDPIFWVSGVASSLTRFGPLLPAYVGASDMEDVPPAAIGCGTTRARTP
ncbi:hypothetical protein [Conyzicola nivalis]|uniref:hypothetical protein n=1 Tax=Conyzicola nivalis TaxID=1477021 RepID=UPI001669CC51|nr:hypothetical protein [Conyzicola nivalis]